MSPSRVPADHPTNARPTNARPTTAGPTNASPTSIRPTNASPTGETSEPTADPAQIATDLRAALGPLVRRLRQFKADDELTLSQTSALARLDREGPATASELAAGEGIRPQSMFTIIGALQERGLVAREPDPHDGRRIVVSVTATGREGLHGARTEKARRLTAAVADELTPSEQRQLAAALPLLARIARRV